MLTGHRAIRTGSWSTPDTASRDRNERRLAGRQRFWGRMAAVCCLCALAALADGLWSGGNSRTVSLPAGGSTRISGPMPSGTPDLAGLVVQASIPEVSLTATGQFAGYWLGDRKWRGKLRVAPGTPPGAATLTVGGAGSPPQAVSVRIFSDQAAMDAASPSMVRRLTGWSPLALAAGAFLAAGLFGAEVYRIGKKLDALWRAAGNAVISRIVASPDGLTVFFGLGAADGIAPGDAMLVRDATGRTVALGAVRFCGERDAVALFAGSPAVKPGYRISREKPARRGPNARAES